MESESVKPPFPWYGGKRKVAHVVWERLGSVEAYVEPFFGAGAVLLARPNPRGVETINDVDCLVVNFWRAVRAAPEMVADEFRGLLSESEYRARARDIAKALPTIADVVHSGTDAFNSCVAGWWAYCVCLSVGQFDPEAPGRMHIGRWSGILALDQAGALDEYLAALAHRLLGVRVLCGDWSRAVSSAATTFHGEPVGVFLDPPYGVADRSKCYRFDDRELAWKVQDWCIEHGKDSRYRIVLCGYDGEYDLPGWETIAWSANGGQGSRGGRGQANRRRERLWISPHCERVLPLEYFDAGPSGAAKEA